MRATAGHRGGATGWHTVDCTVAETTSTRFFAN
jgi:hypothetical protein